MGRTDKKAKAPEFKDRIKSLRKERDMTTTVLGSILGKSDTAIRMWETGRSKPDADTLIKIAKLFECSTDYLLGLADCRNDESYKSTIESQNALLSALSKLDDKERLELNESFANVVDSISMLLISPNLREPYWNALILFLHTLTELALPIPTLYDVQARGTEAYSIEMITKLANALPTLIIKSANSIHSIAVNLSSSFEWSVDFLCRGKVSRGTTAISVLLDELKMDSKG